MPITNRLQADSLTQIIHTIRATRGHGTADWHPKAIENVLRDNHTHPAPYGDIVVALTKYARDSDKHVPSFLFDALADWKEPGDTRPRNPCEDHPEQSAVSCPNCLADWKSGIRPKEFIGKTYDIPMTGLD